jgi:hypothetical protein
MSFGLKRSLLRLKFLSGEPSASCKVKCYILYIEAAAVAALILVKTHAPSFGGRLDCYDIVAHRLAPSSYT